MKSLDEVSGFDSVYGTFSVNGSPLLVRVTHDGRSLFPGRALFLSVVTSDGEVVGDLTEQLRRRFYGTIKSVATAREMADWIREHTQ